VLKILQEFDPPGIGARNLRECLLIQINRQIRSTHSDDIIKLELLRLERQIVDECHDLLVNNNADKIAQRTGVSVMRANVAMEGIKRLNPRPGMALSESAADRSQTVVPDFIIETDGEGGISFTLNDGYVPALRVDKCFEREFLEGQERYAGMNQRERDAFAYRKQKVESARMFIDAIAMRRRTLYVTMKAIVELQREFFLTQDDTKIKPMILRDVAEKTNLDESTVSRVKSSKYALVDGHVYPLDHFFLRARVNSKGDLVFGHKVMQMIREIIDSEDKLAPYSDEKLVELLLEKGQDIKHRTVTKYRNQMGIPPARLRKKL
jgi:RNA polymerase sigma-54 factor